MPAAARYCCQTLITLNNRISSEEEAMSFYMVYICHSVSDRAQLEKYWTFLRPSNFIVWWRARHLTSCPD